MAHGNWEARQAILHAINLERDRQDKQWGGPEHDDEHWLDLWLSFIEKQRQLAWATTDPSEVRVRLIKIAALAVAAVESFDRRMEKL